MEIHPSIWFNSGRRGMALIQNWRWAIMEPPINFKFMFWTISKKPMHPPHRVFWTQTSDIQYEQWGATTTPSNFRWERKTNIYSHRCDKFRAILHILGWCLFSECSPVWHWLICSRWSRGFIKYMWDDDDDDNVAVFKASLCATKAAPHPSSSTLHHVYFTLSP